MFEPALVGTKITWKGHMVPELYGEDALIKRNRYVRHDVEGVWWSEEQRLEELHAKEMAITVQEEMVRKRRQKLGIPSSDSSSSLDSDMEVRPQGVRINLYREGWIPHHGARVPAGLMEINVD
eukprot:Trichotokara_eunicae@DN7646_c0_g1_i1.p1